MPTDATETSSAETTGRPPASSVDSERQNSDSAVRWKIEPTSGRRSFQRSIAASPAAVRRHCMSPTPSATSATDSSRKWSRTKLDRPMVMRVSSGSSVSRPLKKSLNLGTT